MVPTCEDGVAADGDRLRGRSERIRGVDLGVVDDEIDGPAAVVALGTDDQSGDERSSHDRDNDVSG